MNRTALYSGIIAVGDIEKYSAICLRHLRTLPGYSDMITYHFVINLQSSAPPQTLFLHGLQKLQSKEIFITCEFKSILIMGRGN